tara:strand:+ start:1176 stop:1805 length:630 start_codon:yes stop_codon:yes gene_type:complete
MINKSQPGKKENARSLLLKVALNVIRQKGYNATSVDELCSQAGVTKGAFFHHFKDKESLAVAAAEYWSETTGNLFATAAYHNHKDPLDRIIAYIDFRAELIQGPVEGFTCLAGTMVQETYGSSHAIRLACERCIFDHTRTLVPFIEAAFEQYGKPEGLTAESLANYTQAALQGGFILAKAQASSEPARESIAHLKKYIQMLFNQPKLNC